MSILSTEVQLIKTPVSSLEEIAPGVFLLSFTRQFNFIPGQVVAINNGIEQFPRLYWITSGYNDPEIKVLFNTKEDGFLTPNLTCCSSGDKILVSKAFGNFICKEDDAWWIASGTGIAPFVSMILSGPFRNNILIHGGKTLRSFYFEKEIASKMGNRYIRCCSHEKGNGVFEGSHIQFLKEQDFLPVDKKYYLCGKSDMISETREILISKGVPLNNIIYEIYP